MSSAPLLNSNKTIRLQIVRGPQRGEKNYLKNSIKIGRAPENDLSFPSDVKVSREHAEIYIENGQTYIRNLSRSNGLTVNGAMVNEGPLSAGAVIQIGDSEFIFQPTDNPGRVIQSAPPPAYQAFPGDTKAGSSRVLFYIVAAIIIGGIFMLARSGNKKTALDDLRTSDEVAQEMLRSENLMKELQKKQIENGEQSAAYKMAQEHYIKGFRDYRNGQFSRAIQSFQAALSFYPQHDLSKKYLILSKRKFDELAQFNMIQGRKYLAKSNFRMCASSFSKVMVMIRDSNDPVYKEARQFFEECQMNLQGRF